MTDETAALQVDQVKPHRIIVSGITGHVGRELARQLLIEGADVHGFTCQDVSLVSAFPSDVKLHHIDTRGDTFVRLFEAIRPETVVHLAALARHDHEVTDVVPFLDANILYGTQLLEAMRLSGCRRFITAESILQYSDVGEYRALNLYAATKQAFSDLLLYYVDAFKLSAIALVLPTIYSEYETVPKLMTDTTRALQNGTTLRLQMKDVLIDFLHVEDVANGFVKACSLLEGEELSETSSFKRYFLSSGRHITPVELVGLFEKIGERKLTILRDRMQSTSRRMRPWRGPTLPGWVAHVDLETGIRRMLSVRHQRRRM